MPIVTAPYPQGMAFGSQVRASQEETNANMLLDLSLALSACGSAIATTTTKAKTVNTLTFTVLGTIFSKAGTDNFWTLGGAGSATVVAASMFQKYLLLVDTSGAASVLEGTQAPTAASNVTWTNIAAYSRYAAILTALGSTKCCAAVMTVATDATHTFTPGTTALNAAGITTTFADGIDQSLLPLVASENGTIVGNGG